MSFIKQRVQSTDPPNPGANEVILYPKATGYFQRGETGAAVPVGQAAVGDHEAAADPHAQYQLRTEKGAANGYASLDADARLPDAQIPLSGLEQFSTGRVEFAGFTRLGGLTLRVGAGRGYRKAGPPNESAPATVTEVVWAQTDVVLADDEVRRIGIDDQGDILVSATPLNQEEVIILGTVRTSGGEIRFLSLVDIDLIHPISDIHTYLASVIGGAAVSGLLVSEHVAPSLQLAVDPGSYYIAKDLKTLPGAAPATWTTWYRDGAGGWTSIASQNTVDPDVWDDGSGTLQPVPVGEWTKPVLYAAPDTNSTAEFHLIVGQATFPTQGEAEGNGLPSPPDEFASQAIRLGAPVVQEGATGIATVVQVQPRLGSFAPPITDTNDHGLLLGLGGDDHPQYQLRSEKGAASGYAPLDSGLLVPLSHLPGHASTHQHGGSDQIATATPAANAIPKANGSGVLDPGWLPAGGGGISQVLGGLLLNGNKTTTSTSFVAMPGTTLTSFAPAAGEWVLVTIAGVWDYTVDGGGGGRYGVDVAHDNSGAFVRVSGADRGLIYIEPPNTDELPFASTLLIQLPNAVSTTFRMEFAALSGGGSLTVFADGTDRTPLTFQVARF